MFLELVVDDWMDLRLPTSIESRLCDQASHRCSSTFLVGSRVWRGEELPQVPSAEGREKQGQGKAGPLAAAGEGHLVTVGWEELPQPRGQRVGGSCLVAPLLVLD